LLFFFKTIGLCKKTLEAMTMAEHEGNVFCKQCYARKFGIRGVGFGVGAGALGMDTGDRFGNTESLSYVNICI
jgi:cysteine/glycine-rich protein